MHCPAHRRDRLLDRACKGRADLRREVSDLLARELPDEAWLESPVAGAATHLLELSHLVGRTGYIGRYRIGEVIAVGGMGVVLRGTDESTDNPRTVAIKILPRCLCTRRTLRAFRRERRLLEQLDHPNITRILESGLCPDGQPYIVMEYVDGHPIDEYFRLHATSIEDRLSLFRAVCLAVHYAHQNLIVHRDLKPGNILVGEGGVVKLLDFGIAKLLDQDARASASQTETMMDAMTLQYSSPEQIRGEPITTSTDVYSLGVILYEILAGRPPYDLSRSSRYEAEKTICELTPISPREASMESAVQWSSALDRITIMAMHKEPGRRYASAEQLAEDIRRYLDGVTVMAYKPGRFERAVGLMKKHRVAFGVAAASFAAVCTLSIVSAFAAHEATVSRDRERKARQVSQSINGFMSELLAMARPQRLGSSDPGLHVLQEASALVEHELGDQPSIAAGVYMQIASAYYNLRRDAESIRNYRSALACLRRSDSPDKEGLAECLGSLGAALSYRDDEEGLTLQREALQLRRELYGESDLRVAKSMHGVGFALTRCARPPRYKEAEELYRAALDMRRRLGDEESAATAHNLHALAALMRHQNRLEESANQYEKALALSRRVLRPLDGQLIDLLNDYAACLRDLKRYDQAKALLKESVAMTTQALGEVAASSTLASLASLTCESGDRSTAWQLMNLALAQLSRAVSADRLGPAADHWRSMTRKLGEQSPEPQIEAYREFIANLPLSESTLQVPPSTYCHVLAHLATIAVQTGQHQLASEVAGEAIRAMDMHDLESWPVRIELRQTMASALIGVHRTREARSLLTEVYNELRERRGPKHRETRNIAERITVLDGLNPNQSTPLN
jgi:serine/threonine-protein kinase